MESPTTNGFPKVYTIDQIAEMLSISDTTVWRWVDTGELPSLHFGKVRRIIHDDFMEFLRRHKE